ncbi:hypothetical protein D9757_002336 [Collybiopsis confluens]|uniref:Integrase core domain-containing protein n=1 Tax=Collybiopsis confluens TaxID=2823264 RepID=A0A8H5HY13_9AGAR|nr:hypothetical protein D9757_002336 [Collybiopsis confluens]
MTDSEAEIVAELLGPLSNQNSDDDPQPNVLCPETSVPRTANSSRNRFGKNQHLAPRIGDEHIHQILLEYHRRNITNKNTISKLLKADHSITLSAASVTRHKAHWGISASKVTTKHMPELEKRQAVFDEMENDPNGQRGPRVIKERIALNQGIHLTRKYVTTVMRSQEPDGFQAREPTAKKIKRGVLVCLGPHHEWSGDGHDKLSAIGFPIWGIRDVWSGKWLGLWVVPNNRLKIVIAYLFLLLVHKLGGIPVQMTTDCGSELVMVYGFANALRETFASDLAVDILPAHWFLQSIHNITIERGWLRLRLDWGDNVKIFWDAGSNIYNESNETHSDLAKWLWSTLIQAELDSVWDAFNNHCVRKDRVKFLPSGVSPNVAFSLYEHYAADNGLLPVDRSLIEKLMEDLGGEELIRFVSKEYEQKAKDVFREIGSPKLTMKNVWNIFQDMLPHM